MQILWISHLIPYPPKGGVLQRSFNLLKQIAQYGEISLIAIDQPELRRGTKTEIEEAEQKLRDICKKVWIYPVNINKNVTALKSLFSCKPYTSNWRSFKAVTCMLKEWCEEHKFDVAHFDSIDLGSYVDVVGQIPKVLNHHNIESQMMYRRMSLERNALKKLYFYQETAKLAAYEKRICQKFDYNVTVSHLDQQRLLSRLPDLHVEIIPNGVDTEYFKPLLTKFHHPQRLLFAGGMSWYPNRDAMLFFAKDIWPKLKKKFPSISASIVGRNPPVELVDKSKEDSSFEVLGFVDDVRPYFESAHAYICPIRDGGGTKLKILDALSMGKPIVAHPIAIEGLDVQSEKHLLIAETPSEFVEQIGKIFNNPNLCQSLSREGRKIAVQYYDYKCIGLKLSQIYQRTCSMRRRP